MPEDPPTIALSPLLQGAVIQTKYVAANGRSFPSAMSFAQAETQERLKIFLEQTLKAALKDRNAPLTYHDVAFWLVEYADQVAPLLDMLLDVYKQQRQAARLSNALQRS